MSIRDRLKKLEKNRPAPRPSEATDPEPEQEGFDLYWLIDQERKRAQGLEPDVLPYPPEARRRDELRSLETTAWYRERWLATGTDCPNELAFADEMERDALAELARIDSGFYSADSTTNDTYRGDDE